MQQQIVLISGEAGSGKSTCGKLLYDRLESVALIEADAIIKVKPWENFAKLRKLALSNVAALIQNFWNAGYRAILCPGVVWNQDDMNALCAALPNLTHAMTLLWLQTDEKERNRRRANRHRDAADLPQEFSNVDDAVAGKKPTTLPSGKAYEISTTYRTPAEIVKEMMCILQ